MEGGLGSRRGPLVADLSEQQLLDIERAMVEDAGFAHTATELWGLNSERFRELVTGSDSQAEVATRLLREDLLLRSLHELAEVLPIGGLRMTLQESLAHCCTSHADAESGSEGEDVTALASLDSADQLPDNRSFTVDGTQVDITTVVSTFEVGVPLDLVQLAVHVECIYEPSKFNAVILKSEQRKASCLIFSSGKIVVTGKTTEFGSQRYSVLIFRLLFKVLDGQGQFLNFRIQNMVSTASYGSRLDLVKLADHSDEIEYNPQLFPGAIWKMTDPKMSALIFCSGRIVFTGARTRQTIAAAVRLLMVVLPEFQIQDAVPREDEQAKDRFADLIEKVDCTQRI